jgi:hypothetical protein
MQRHAIIAFKADSFVDSSVSYDLAHFRHVGCDARR